MVAGGGTGAGARRLGRAPRPPVPETPPVPYAPLLLVGVLLALVLPWWPWSRGWGYTPAVMIAVVFGTAALFLTLAGV